MSERNKIVYGQWTFADEDIHTGNMYVAMALMSDSLEANTFSATVECADRSIIDFQRNAPLTYYYKGIQRGIFYVQSITREGPTTYTISATSAIGLLIDGLHYGGIYTGQTVAEVLPSICGTVPYVVKTNLRDIALYGWLPVASPRNNLSQVLFAIGAVIRTDLDGVLHIERLWDGISGTLARDRMYQGPSVIYESKVTQVVVTEHQYVEGGEETSLFEGTAQAGDIITFDGPMYNLQAAGFTILESNANYAKLSAGTGTLTGTAYVHNTRQIAENVLEANEPNVVTVEDATLVSLINSRTVATRIANYYKSYQTINTDAEYEGEDPGDVLSAWHPYDQEAVPACLENADINLSNALKAEESILVDFKPLVEEEEEILENKVILTGSGTWTAPPGATSAHVVLIGGGGPGGDGADGESTILNTKTDEDDGGVFVGQMQPGEQTSDNTSASASTASAPAGEGGEGGAAGVPGYVLEVDLDLTEGQAFAYNCGSAGATAEQTGGESTFGEYSSKNGGVLPAGYTDLTTGEVYAVPGSAGVKGGNGGNQGQRGEDVAGATGGAGAAGKSDSDSGSGTYTLQGCRCTKRENGSYTIPSVGGGGAGGGTETNPGSNGKNGRTANGSISVSSSRTSRAYVSVGDLLPGGGGNGANGEDAKTYGSAGNGGSGGGGAGATGSATASASSSITAVSERYTNDIDVADADSAVRLQGAWTMGGAGGKGGAGAAGCIIVYYGVRKTIETGQVVDGQNRLFLDKFGRRLVV